MHLSERPVGVIAPGIPGLLRCLRELDTADRIERVFTA
jgi:hypothetical protein